MTNLLTPIQELGFNVQDLKPGMIVKFSILSKENTSSIRIENHGIIDVIKHDRLGIIANASSSRLICDEENNFNIDASRYRKALVPFENDDVSNVWSFYDACNDSVYIVFGIKDAKRLSLELSFLDVDRHCYDPMTTRKLYYWR